MRYRLADYVPSQPIFVQVGLPRDFTNHSLVEKVILISHAQPTVHFTVEYANLDLLDFLPMTRTEGMYQVRALAEEELLSDREVFFK